MPATNPTRFLAMARRTALVALALGVAACASSGPPRPKQVETRDESGGFQIAEEVRVGGGLRSDFDEAVRLLEQQEYDRGIALLLEVTKANPSITAAHIDLGIAYGRVGDLAAAEASLRKALELNPRHPVVHNELGIVLRRAGRFDQARQSYEAALSLYPAFHYARRNLAILCDLYLQDRECALAQYEAYSAAVPQDESAAMWIADLRTRMGR